MQSTVLCARDLMSNKGQKVHNYPLKVAAIEYVESHGNRAAERKFAADRKRIQENGE